MKLGEALTRRRDLQIEQLRGRLKAVAFVQEGEPPAEDPMQLLAELDRLTGELEQLIVRINRTNLAVGIGDGRTLTEALARRDVLTLRETVLRQLAEFAGQRLVRHGRSEIRLLAEVDVAALRADADALARERRELDVEIQETNWRADVVA